MTGISEREMSLGSNIIASNFLTSTEALPGQKYRII